MRSAGSTPTNGSFRCAVCGSLAAFPLLAYEPPEGGRSLGVWRYRRSFPVDCAPLSLGEGATPLLSVGAPSLAPGPGRVFLKIESGNPSGSFKDRGTALVVAAARSRGHRKLTLASTGNAAASVASYVARCELEVVVLVPSSIDVRRLSMVSARGAEVRQVAGGFEECEVESQRLAADGYFPAGSDNPFRTEGTKTIVYEIVEQMGAAGCDRILVPIGSGGLIAAVHKGLLELARAGRLARLPRLDGVLLEGFPPPHSPASRAAGHPCKDTVASGINIPRPLLAANAAAAVKGTGGQYHFVTDREILAAQGDLARCEGVPAEPTGCVAMAAYRQALGRGRIDPGERVVVLVTGKTRSLDA
jgi:threonine synthase